MCRSIKVLRRKDNPATQDEIVAAAKQFVRKISGCQKPSRANQDAFERAVQEISAISSRLLGDMTPASAPRHGRLDPPQSNPTTAN